MQGWSLPWVARRLQIAAPITPRDVEVESAPLDELDADLMQLTVPPGSRLHGVYLPGAAAARGRRRRPRSCATGAPSCPTTPPGCGAATRPCWCRPGARAAEAERRLRAVSRAGRLASWRGETGAATEAD